MGQRRHLRHRLDFLELHRGKLRKPRCHLLFATLQKHPFHRSWQVQIIFQYLPPGFYWGSELLYCMLSLSAKLYLGFFLLVNVIMTDGTVEGALSPADGQ